MEYILNALCATMLAYIWIEVIEADLLIKKWVNYDGQMKPLDCRLCMSFWCGVTIGATDPMTALQTGLIAVFFERLMWRFEI